MSKVLIDGIVTLSTVYHQSFFQEFCPSSLHVHVFFLFFEEGSPAGRRQQHPWTLVFFTFMLRCLFTDA